MQKSSLSNSLSAIFMKGGMIYPNYVLMKQDAFPGTFTSDRLSTHVPEPLLTFMEVLLQGPKTDMERSRQPQRNDEAD